MSDTTSTVPQKRKVGRPPIPNKERISLLHLYIRNRVIDRLEEAAPSFQEARAAFAETVIERGLDALEQDQTYTREDGSNLDHAVTYPQLSE